MMGRRQWTLSLGLVVGLLATATLGCETRLDAAAPLELADAFFGGAGDQSVSATDKEIAGAQMEWTRDAWSGHASQVTISPGQDLVSNFKPPQKLLVTSVGPAVSFEPDGVTFAEPVRLKLPFSTETYNTAEAKERRIGVLVQSGKDPVKFEVGPIGLERIGFEVGPIGFEVGPIGFEVGPIGLEANIADDKGNDGVYKLGVTHFTTYQVVLVDGQCQPDCDGKKPGADDGCARECTDACTLGAICHGDLLLECNNGVLRQQDCAADNRVCTDRPSATCVSQ